MEHFVCATCGVQFAASDGAARRVPDLRGRAPVRPARTASGGRRSPSSRPTTATSSGPRSELTGVGTDAALRDRPAGAARAQRARATCSGTASRCSTRRRRRRSRRAAASPRSRSRTRTTTRRWSSGPTASTARCCCTPTTRSGSCAPTRRSSCGRARRARSAASSSCAAAGTSPAAPCCWPGGAGGAGALLSGDIVQVIPDRAHVGFMYSYPNLIPLPAAAVAADRRRARAVSVRADLRRVVGPDRPPRRQATSSGARLRDTSAPSPLDAYQEYGCPYPDAGTARTHGRTGSGRGLRQPDRRLRRPPGCSSGSLLHLAQPGRPRAAAGTRSSAAPAATPRRRDATPPGWRGRRARAACCPRAAATPCASSCSARARRRPAPRC